MRIKFWSVREGGCAWYRSHEFRRALHLRGHAVSWTPSLDPNDRLPEILHAQRLYAAPNLDLWRALKAHGGCKLVYDIDDDLFNVPRWSSAHQLYGLPEVQRGISEHLKLSDAVIVSTRQLVHVVKQHTDAPVHVLQNTVPEGLVLNYHGGAGQARGTVGWGGSMTHNKDWTSGISKAVKRATVRNNGQFAVIGAPHAAADLHIPWQTDVWQYYARLQEFGVGLAPLTTHVFNNSKSHIKILEYAALGIPFVASPEPPYRGFSNKAGFLADSPKDWERHITTLLTNNEVYWEMARAGKQLAAEYTTERHAENIESVFASVL